jgi:hypothetical protein
MEPAMGNRDAVEATERGEILDRLCAAVSPQILTQARTSLARLRERCGQRGCGDGEVLLPFGGGKDSAWTLAYLRLMQLLRLREAGCTFRLHVLFMVHPGVPPGVFENVRNVLEALEINDGKYARVVTSTLGGTQIELRFGTIHEDLVEVFRQEILISGHLAQGNGRETFCNSCNFSLMAAIAEYVRAQRGTIHFLVTGDSNTEVVAYWKWVQKTASLFTLEKIEREKAGWAGLFGKLSEIQRSYYERLLGPRAAAGPLYVFPDVTKQDFEPPEYFGVFGDTRYEFWSHNTFLEQFLGFRLREDAFNFTESDCRNPMLMAHLRGLLADFEGRGYIAGVHEYLKLAITLMRSKSYSQDMIDLALAPYRDVAGILRRGREAEEHAQAQYRITPPQLEALVASPLTDGLERLERYLAWSCPWKRDLLRPLQSYLKILREPSAGGPAEGSPDEQLSRHVRSVFLASGSGTLKECEEVEGFLATAFGLRLQGVRLLLRRSSVTRGAGACPAELEILRAGDPHKLLLGTEPGKANNLITGR